MDVVVGTVLIVLERSDERIQGVWFLVDVRCHVLDGDGQTASYGDGNWGLRYKLFEDFITIADILNLKYLDIVLFTPHTKDYIKIKVPSAFGADTVTCNNTAIPILFTLLKYLQRHPL
jgi:hypothetical protein